MAEVRLVDGRLLPRSRDESFILRIQLFGEDANRFEQFCIENDFESSVHALRALILGGMSEWPKWGVGLADRKRIMYEFKQELSKRWGTLITQLVTDVRDEYAALEPPEAAPHAHQT